jgi:hypothetical protein
MKYLCQSETAKNGNLLSPPTKAFPFRISYTLGEGKGNKAKTKLLRELIIYGLSVAFKGIFPEFKLQLNK